MYVFFQSNLRLFSGVFSYTVSEVRMTEKPAQTAHVQVQEKWEWIPYKRANTCTKTYNSLRCPELVWPSARMWSEAGNVWAMKACVYAGCSRPPPARGKTDTSTTSFTLHLLSSSSSKPFSVIFSHLWLTKSLSLSHWFLPSFPRLTVHLFLSPQKSELQAAKQPA